MESEVWAVIPGSNDLYEVSTHGRWRRVGYPEILCIMWKPDRQKPDKLYGHILLSIKGKRKYMLIHRAVALAHIPNPADKPCVDHVDGDSTNNNITNLRWATRSENMLNRRPTPGRTLPKGVSLSGDKFRAQFRDKYLGTFSTAEEAHAAYVATGLEFSPFFNSQ